jgi:hypothetical protein
VRRRSCLDCEYEYTEVDLERTANGQEGCPRCGSTNVGIEVEDSYTGSDGMVSIEITTHLWQIWLGIAIDRAKAARQAREEAVCAIESSGTSKWLLREFEASLVAVAASAHALDAFYGSTYRVTMGVEAVPVGVEAENEAPSAAERVPPGIRDQDLTGRGVVALDQ